MKRLWALIFLLVLIGIFASLIIYNTIDKHYRIKSVTADLNQETQGKVLTQEGKIPEWLKGTFVRNGPVEVQIGHQKLGHRFDGLAMLHAFSFQDGKVIYSNKFLRTDAYHSVFKEGSLNFVGFDRPASSFMWEKLRRLFSFNSRKSQFPIENANVNVFKFADQYVALTEIPLPVRFDIQSLDTLGVFDYPDALPKSDTFESAHPQFDQVKNEKINYLVDYGRESKYVIYRLNPKVGGREIISEIPVEKPAYMHSFAITENYIILVEFPFVVNPLDLVVMTKPFIQNFNWEPQRGTHFLIIDKKTGKLVKTIKDYYPFFAFHHVNAYERVDEKKKGNEKGKANEKKEGKSARNSELKIVMDIVTYPDASIISSVTGNVYSDSTNKNNTENNYKTKLMRYTIPMEISKDLKVNANLQINSDLGSQTNNNESQVASALMESTLIFDGSLEYPRINEALNGQKYRYLYAADVRPLNEKNDLRPIYKIDMETHKIIYWQQPGLLPGEPVFIANSNNNRESHKADLKKIEQIETELKEAELNSTEDDGVIVSIVLDAVKNTAFLLVLDAKTFQELGRVYAPYPIPLGLHGQFFEG